MGFLPEAACSPRQGHAQEDLTMRMYPICVAPIAHLLDVTPLLEQRCSKINQPHLSLRSDLTALGS